MVRYSPTAFPTSSTDGTLASDVSGTAGGTSTTTVAGLTNTTTYYFSLFSHNATPVYSAAVKTQQLVMAEQFTDDFSLDVAGSIDGQNGWDVVGGTWSVVDTSGEHTLQSGTDTAGFHVYRALNGGDVTANTNQMVRVDWRGSTTALPGQVFLRAQSTTADAGGYFLWQTGTQIRLAYKPSVGSTHTTLAQAAFVPTASTWYTYEFSVVDNALGQPVLTAYVWARGNAKPSIPTVMYTDTMAYFADGVFSLGKTGTTLAEYDNVTYYGATPSVTMTSPSADVAGAPNVATLAITDDGGTMYIPYIQTSTTLNVTANATALPVGGGVEFVVGEGTAAEQSSTDTSSPYTASFTGLEKGEYIVNAYALHADGVTRYSSAGTHDERTNVGIGDIITVIGDSVTEGVSGTIDSGVVTSWLDADAGTVSADNRQFPQYGAFGGTYKESFLTDLQDKLSTYYDYPVFLMNEGVAGIRASNYETTVMNAAWQARQTALAPNGWIITLGVNDAYIGRTAVQYEADVTSIIDTLTATYGATASQIYLNYPNYDGRTGTAGADSGFVTQYVTVVDALRTSLGLQGGADLYNTTYAHRSTDYRGAVHPNATGYVRIARLVALSHMQPTALSVSYVTSTAATVNWSSISAYEATIAGYDVVYGTASDALTSTATFGDVTNGTVTGLTPSTTYYFAVQAFDNDTAALSTSDESNVLSITTSP